MAAVLQFRPADPLLPRDEAATLQKLKDWFSDSEDYFKTANDRAMRDRDYVDGRQWTAEEMAARDADEKATLCMNRIGPKIRFMVGLEAENQTDPKAWPRNQETDEQSADLATSALKYVADLNDLNTKFGDGYEGLLVEGIECFDVTVKRCQDGSIDPLDTQIPWDRFFYDPFSRKRDFSDARYLGSVAWLDEDEAIAQWPGKESLISATFGGVGSGPYEDRPTWNIGGHDRGRLRVLQAYWKEGGKWMHAKFTDRGFLEGPHLSPWVDEYGEPECALVAGCVHINQDNERYGAVREMIDAQDEINKRHSDAVTFLTARQTWGDAGAVKDVNDAKREWAKPRGHTEITPGLRFEVFPTTDLTGGNLEALRLAREEIDLKGPNASMIGKRDRAESGKAIIAQQEGGKMEMAAFGKAHADLKKRVHRANWHRIRQFWKGPKWIRVVDDEKKVSAVALNMPVTYGQQLAAQNGGQIPAEIQAQYGPVLNEVAQVQNPIGMLDVDIVIDETVHNPVSQLEQFDLLTNLALQGQKMGAAIPFKAIIQASTLRDKDKLLSMIDEERQAQQQAQQQQDAMYQAQVQADVQKKQAEAQRALDDASKTRMETVLLQMQAMMAQMMAQMRGYAPPPQPMMQQPNLPPPGAGMPPAMGAPMGAAPIPQQPLPTGASVVPVPQPPPPGMTGAT